MKNEKDEKNGYAIITKTLRLSKKNGASFSQSFKSVVPTYALDEKNHILVETGFKDLVKEINSYADCALDKMLDKFLESSFEFQNQYEIHDDGSVRDLTFNNDLASLGDVYEQVDLLKEKYGLDVNMSINDVYKFIEMKKAQIKQKIESLQK